MAKDKNARRLRLVRHARVRKKVSGTLDRPRLCVFRSLRHIYAQIIDDTEGHTLVSASSHETNDQQSSSAGPKVDVSVAVGKMVAERAKSNGGATSPAVTDEPRSVPAEAEAGVPAATVDSIRALMLIRAHRVRGHLLAGLDPLALDGHQPQARPRHPPRGRP